MDWTRTIDAPLEKVFSAVASIDEFSKAIPDIKKVEFLTEQTTGVGTRFIETREMWGKEAATELEVTEYVENDRIRLVAESGYTLWDSLFTVEPAGEQTRLVLKMDATPLKFRARFLNLFMGTMIKKAIAQDMDAVKVYCERETSTESADTIEPES